MDHVELHGRYFTYESRLESFTAAQPIHKKRSSNASMKASKKLKWPHRSLNPENFAQAGFYFKPREDSPNNVTCFLCDRSMDGWEEDDDPLAEHLKHSPECGWAVVASIARQDPELMLEFPASPRMIAARKATFADRWPHENKRGWKCKVKQMVEAGWMYTPISESDDMATCSYCQLALDGWENSDEPLVEHYNRSNECPFFSLIDNHKQSVVAKKGEKARTSKASRLPSQSTLTMNTEQTTVVDNTRNDDSDLTTASATTTGRKKVGAKKATTVKSKKTRAKKKESMEVAQLPEPEDDDFEVKVTRTSKANVGRKRKSENMEDHIVETMAPATKRRNTRTRGSLAMEDSTLEGSMMDTSVVAAKKRKPAKPRGRQAERRSTRSSRGASAVRTQPVESMDDEELDRVLEADLDRMSDEEDIVEPVLSKTRGPRSSQVVESDHAMFGVKPIHIDEAAIDAELEKMEIDSKPLLKSKGKAKQPRKVSAKQQAAAAKAAEAAATAEVETQRVAEEASPQVVSELEQSTTIQQTSPAIAPKRRRATSRQATKRMPKRKSRVSHISIDESDINLAEASQIEVDEVNLGYESEASIASQATVVKGGQKRRGSTLKKGLGGKRGAARKIEDVISKLSPLPMEMEMDISKPRSGQAASSLRDEDRSMTEDVFYTPAPEPLPVEEKASQTAKAGPMRRGKPLKAAVASTSVQQASVVDQSILSQQGSTSTRYKVLTPEPSRSATPPAHNERTPSRSPQSSDAENQPPSSKPSIPRQADAATPHNARDRVPLALAISTPVLSPSKRNIIAGLQSTHPWTAVDLHAIFSKSPGGENIVHGMLDGALQRLKQGDGGLSKEEMSMSVEEWIHDNAMLAEEKLRKECETMVACFEREGGRAMRVLEGLECSE